MCPRTKEQFEAIRQERKAQIVTAARRLFAQQGFHGTRMSEIAEAVGVSQGTIYHYFSSKDELFMSMFSNWAEQLEDAVTGLPDVPLSATQKLWMMSRVATAFLGADRDLLPVFVEFCAYALHNPTAAANFRAVFQGMQRSAARILEEGIASGEFRPIDSDTLSLLPLIVLDGVILLHPILGNDILSPDLVIEQTMQLVLDGLLVEGEEKLA
jgi:AcrR family transcriptional regulator